MVKVMVAWIGLMGVAASSAGACDYFLRAGSPRARFAARALEILDADVITPDDAAFIGRKILEYPDFYLRRSRVGRVGPLHRLFQDPACGRAFFAANAYNGMFLGDVMGQADRFNAPGHRASLHDAAAVVIRTGEAELRRRFPRLDVVRAQANAVTVASWLDPGDSDLKPRALEFLTLSSIEKSRRQIRRAIGLMSFDDARRARALAAATLVRGYLRQNELTDEELHVLVDAVREPNHPFAQVYWVALDAPERLPAWAIEGLRPAWAALLISKNSWWHAGAPRLAAWFKARL